MFTATEIRGIQFEINRKGYNVEDVRAFLNQLAYQYGKLESEKAELEQNMLVLADKLDEYRKEEEKLSAALFNAQKISENIIEEARQKAEIIIGDAQISAENIMAEANAAAEATIAESSAEAVRIVEAATAEADAQAARAARELQNYESVRVSAIEFKSTLLELYNSHLELLDLVDLGEEEYAENIAADAVYGEEVVYDEADVADEYVEAAEISEEYEISEEAAQVIAENEFSFNPDDSNGFSTVEFEKLTDSADQFISAFDVEAAADEGFDTSDLAVENQDIFAAAELDEAFEQQTEEFSEENVEQATAVYEEPVQEEANELQRPIRKTRYARRSVQSGVGLGEARSKDRELKFGTDFSFDI